MERAAAIFLLLVPYIVTIAGCQSPQQTAAMGALLSGNAVYASDPQRAAALATLGSSATGFANAQASAPQVNVNNTNQPTASDSSIQYVTNYKMKGGNTYTGPLKPMSDGILYPHGQGVYIWSSGQRYEGEFVNGKRNGYGVQTMPNGERYEGEWKDEKINGHGVYTWPDGKKYEGEFVNDKRNGHGVQTLPTGERYEGEWKDNVVVVSQSHQPTASGSSIRYLKNQKLSGGGTYTGQVKLMSDGLLHPHGHGVYILPDGRRYEGEFANDVRNGRGVQTWPSGERYEGEWKDDLPNGQGVRTYPNGQRYEGDFINNIRNGRGVYTWPTGEKYEGDFKDEKMHGLGKMVCADGRIVEGAWRDDKFVGSQSQVNAGDNQKGQGSSSRFGVVNITADDLTFEVFADGAFVGNSPAKLKLSEGPHTIEVRKNGFKDYKKEIRVADGSELNIRAVLEKQ